MSKCGGVRASPKPACRGVIGWALVSALALIGCGATVDPLGQVPVGDGDGATVGPDSDLLRPLSGPASYPNAFASLLGKSDGEIDAKVSAAFERLFHGDPTNEAIYFTVGDDQAYIQDILHGDVRSEGVGLGMLLALELDQRDEFDRLWRYAHASLEYRSGARRGYFRSSCTGGPCADPYGHQEIAMALLFAHGRWGSRSGDIDYGSEAWRLLNVMWQKEQENGGVVDDVTNLLDAGSSLVVDQPTAAKASYTRPANVKPGYYALWAEATGEARWSAAADAGRVLLKAAAHPKTGLLPAACDFAGEPRDGSGNSSPEGFRAQLNMALDHVFHAPSDFYPSESDALLGFYAGEGISNYGSTFTLDGSMCLDFSHPASLVSMNGVTALASTRDDREAFVQAVWDIGTIDGGVRYYDGLLHLVALVTLSGKLRVY